MNKPVVTVFLVSLYFCFSLSSTEDLFAQQRGTISVLQATALPLSTLTIQDGSSSVHHEYMGDAIKSEVTPNTPPVDETDPRFGKNLIPVTQMA
jgi:hypothetical protein